MGITTDNKELYIEGVRQIHEEISVEVNKSQIDPLALMKLTAIGINHCLVGIATIIEESKNSCESGSRGVTEGDRSPRLEADSKGVS